MGDLSAPRTGNLRPRGGSARTSLRADAKSARSTLSATFAKTPADCSFLALLVRARTGRQAQAYLRYLARY